MQIRQITIENLRTVERLALDLVDGDSPRRLVILVGPNGVGKSTTLAAIAHVYAVLGEDSFVRRLGVVDIRRSALEETEGTKKNRREEEPIGVIRVEAELAAEERRRVREFFPSAPAIGMIQLELGRVGSSRFDDTNPSDPVSHDAERTFQQAAGHALTTSPRAPCVLLPADRGVLTDDPNVTLGALAGRRLGESALDPDRARFAPLAGRLALAFAAGKPFDPQGRAARLWKVLAKYFPELPRPTHVDGLRLIFRNRFSVLVSLDEMSDGERALLLLFAEVATRVADHGVVLIDEVEQHLHPRWQRAALEALVAMAPKTQFIVTTQAPYVPTSAPDAAVKIGDWGRDGA